jgi:hypothetical protein
MNYPQPVFQLFRKPTLLIVFGIVMWAFFVTACTPTPQTIAYFVVSS